MPDANLKYAFELTRKPGSAPLDLGYDGLNQALQSLEPVGVLPNGPRSIIGRVEADSDVIASYSVTLTVRAGTTQEQVRQAIESLLADIGRADVTVSDR